MVLDMNKHGFTLIELVVILVIAGIMIIGAIPSATVQPVLRLEGASQKIASHLRYMQEMAIAQQVRFGLSFDAVNESYFGYRVNVSTKAKDPHTNADMDISFTQLNEFRGIDIVSTNFSDKVEFDSQGSPYNGSGSILVSEGIITLQAADGAYSKSVTIEANTGKVSVE